VVDNIDIAQFATLSALEMVVWGCVGVVTHCAGAVWRCCGYIAALCEPGGCPVYSGGAKGWV
jgi:hypothetical protein